MGAWGPGLQANDTALDAIDELTLIQFLTADKEAQLKRYLEGVFSQFAAWGLLGVVEWFLDNGMPHHKLAMCRTMIDRALAMEKTEIEDWRDPEQRRQVLETLRARLDGRAIDEERLAESNRGLLSRMCGN